MDKTSLILSLLLGILGSLAMFAGDMLLYFTREDFKTDGTLKPFAKIMRRISYRRLWWGGLLGPISAFFYSMGFYSVYLSTLPDDRVWGLSVFLLWTLSIFIGGAYHMQFSCFGIVASSQDQEIIDKLGKSIVSYAKIYILPFFVGQIILAALMLLGKTIYPRWFVLFSPALWLALSALWPKLPQPYKNILAGGWNNLIYTLYFCASLLAVGWM